MEYARNRQTPKNYGGSYIPPDDEAGQEPEQPRKFVLKEKIREMIQYGLPLVDKFPRRNRKLFTGEMTREAFDRRVASYKGMIQHCTNANLRTRLNEIYLHAKERYGGSNEPSANHSRVIGDRGETKPHHQGAGGEPAPSRRHVPGGGDRVNRLLGNIEATGESD